MEKKWLARLHRDPLYKARQLQAIAYESIFMNIVLILLLGFILKVVK